MSGSRQWFGKNVGHVLLGVNMFRLNEAILNRLTDPVILNVDMLCVITDLICVAYHRDGRIAVNEKRSRERLRESNLHDELPQPDDLAPDV